MKNKHPALEETLYKSSQIFNHLNIKKSGSLTQEALDDVLKKFIVKNKGTSNEPDWLKKIRFPKNEDGSPSYGQLNKDGSISIGVLQKDGTLQSMEDYYKQYPWNKPGLSKEASNKLWDDHLKQKNPSNLQTPSNTSQQASVKSPAPAPTSSSEAKVSVHSGVLQKNGTVQSMDNYYEQYPWNRPGLSKDASNKLWEDHLKQKNLSDLQPLPDTPQQASLKLPNPAPTLSSKAEESTTSGVLQKDGTVQSMDDYYKQYPWNNPALSEDESNKLWNEHFNQKNQPDFQPLPDTIQQPTVEVTNPEGLSFSQAEEVGAEEVEAQEQKFTP